MTTDEKLIAESRKRASVESCLAQPISAAACLLRLAARLEHLLAKEAQPPPQATPGPLTHDAIALLNDKVEVWETQAKTGPMELRDYNRRCAEALNAALILLMIEERS